LTILFLAISLLVSSPAAAAHNCKRYSHNTGSGLQLPVLQKTYQLKTDTVWSIGRVFRAPAGRLLLKSIKCLKYIVIRFPVPKPAPEPDPAPDPEPEPQPEPDPQPEPEPVEGLNESEKKMLALLNSEREKADLPPLQVDMELVKLARLKCHDMIELNYFAHQSPTYGSPFDMMRNAGIKYRTAGENLAGAPTVERAHTALMNSPGHRANILNASFTHIGIGAVKGGPYGMMFTQMFIGR
jgi:uncharacterized YkwD family protein